MMSLKHGIARFFFILGVITFLVLFSIALVMGYALYLRSSLTPSAKMYADASVQAIVTNWSENELVERSSTELQADTSKGQLDQVFVKFKTLGALQSCSEAQGDVRVSFSLKRGLTITASYLSTATFQHGRADITLDLIRHGSLWQIQGFHLDPPSEK
jgi:hypothetical protein